MDTRSGEVSSISHAEAERELEAAQKALLADRMPDYLPVPAHELDRVLGMNRHQRRAWARQGASRLRAELRAAKA